ncbi:MAG: hypothetical protein QMC40_02020 [Vicingaceae bacterium]|jgi:hypothetical protein|tara:strand:+ start:57 stop:530 length:474 start_codon:yes stop_codon:yes gene_type:complete
MKKLAIAFFSIATITVLSSAISDTNCDTKILKKEGITELNPFYYSASKVNVVNYDYRASRKEIEVPLFKGEKYKMVFNKKGLPKDVVVDIFDKDKSHANRKSLFTSEGNSAEIISYSPEKSKKMYVRYTIPKADKVKESGCIVFILGYQLTFVTEEK